MTKARAKIELFDKRIEIIYRMGYEDEDCEDEFDVTKIITNESVKWQIESVVYGPITNSSPIGKKLLNYIQRHVNTLEVAGENI